MTPELGAITSAESLAFVLTEAIATNPDVSKEIRDKYRWRAPGWGSGVDTGPVLLLSCDFCNR